MRHLQCGGWLNNANVNTRSNCAANGKYDITEIQLKGIIDVLHTILCISGYRHHRHHLHDHYHLSSVPVAGKKSRIVVHIPIPSRVIFTVTLV